VSISERIDAGTDFERGPTIEPEDDSVSR